MSTLWLQLTEDFGGAIHGPLDAPEVRIGTAPEAEIRVADGLGVEPWHARLTRKPSGAVHLAACSRSAPIWRWPGGADVPLPLHGPVALRPGDGFSLGSPGGVRFELVERADAPPAHATTPTSEDLRALPRGIAQELARRLRASVLATWWGGAAEAAVRFVRQRQYLAPVYLVGAAVAATGWLAAAWQQGERTTLEERLAASTDRGEVCRAELHACQRGDAGDERRDLGALAHRVTGDRAWRESLTWPPMTGAAKAHLQVLFTLDDPLRHDAWFTGPGSPYARVVRALERQADAFPAPLARALAWAAVEPLVALPGSLRGGEGAWSRLASADAGVRACQRGPLRLSYRQAAALGLDARLDALFPAHDLARLDQGGLADRLDRIAVALKATRLGVTPDDPGVLHLTRDGLVRAHVGDGDACFALAGPDERDDLGRIVGALAGVLGVDAPGLPGAGEPAWITARIAKLHALHLAGGAGRGLALDRARMQGAFAEAALGDPEGVEVVAARAGRHAARALALPCLALYRGGESGYPPELGPPPDFDACAALGARAVHGRL